jgi:hypothetical protein
LDFYLSFLGRRGISRGENGTHLQSLVLFTSSRILHAIGGFPTGTAYREAVAREIGSSRLIESKGYRISKVKDQPYELIDHRRLTKGYQLKMTTRRIIVDRLKRLGLKRK